MIAVELAAVINQTILAVLHSGSGPDARPVFSDLPMQIRELAAIRIFHILVQLDSKIRVLGGEKMIFFNSVLLLRYLHL